jgi:hypothetical protein
MSVDQTGIIDFVSTSPEGKIILTISDHHSWEATWHLQLLQSKINAYLQFIEGGQLIEDYPEAVGKEAIIQAVFKVEPTDEAVSFLEKVKAVTVGAGIGFHWKVFNFNE